MSTLSRFRKKQINERLLELKKSMDYDTWERTSELDEYAVMLHLIELVDILIAAREQEG